MPFWLYSSLLIHQHVVACERIPPGKATTGTDMKIEKLTSTIASALVVALIIPGTPYAASTLRSWVYSTEHGSCQAPSWQGDAIGGQEKRRA